MDSFTTTMNLGQASLNLRGMWLPRRSLPSYSRMLTMPAIQMPCGPLAENSKSEDGNTVRLYRVGHTSSRLPDFKPIRISMLQRHSEPLRHDPPLRCRGSKPLLLPILLYRQ